MSTCDCKRASVVDSRKTDYGTLRRRRCHQCGRRFTTAEFEVPPMRGGESAVDAVTRHAVAEYLVDAGLKLKKI